MRGFTGHSVHRSLCTLRSDVTLRGNGGGGGDDASEGDEEEPILRVVKAPYKTEYYPGEELKLDGIGLRYGDTEVSLSDCSYSPRYVPTDQPSGKYTITFKYTKNPQATCTYNVKVLENVRIITGIHPYYHASDVIDRSAMTFKIIDRNGERYVKGFTVSPSVVNENTKKITVTYSQYNEEIPIKVVPATTKIVGIMDVDSESWYLVDSASSTFKLPVPETQPGFFEGWYAQSGEYVGGSGEQVKISSDTICVPRWTPYEIEIDKLGARILSYVQIASLSEVTIPDMISNVRVYAIADGAFEGLSGIKKISIPESVITIEDGAFSDMSALKEFSVDDKNTSFCQIDGILFSKDGSELISCPGAYGAVVAVSGDRISFHQSSIPDSVSTIKIVGGVSEIVFAPGSHNKPLSLIFESEGAHTPVAVYQDPDFSGSPVDTIPPSSTEQHYYVLVSSSMSLSAFGAAIVALAMILSIYACMKIDKSSGNAARGRAR